MINIEISIGEAIDRLSILILKSKYIKEEKKIKFIEKEIENLKNSMIKIGDYSDLLKELIQVNEIMWHCNENRKQKIINKEFDNSYIEMTIEESVVNDNRFLIKDKINKLFKSNIMEQKSYSWIT